MDAAVVPLHDKFLALKARIATLRSSIENTRDVLKDP
jgi:hypothetical protein